MPANQRTPMRLLTFRELEAIHGINFSRQHLQTLEAQKKFPRRVALGERRHGWLASEIEAYLAEKVAAR